MFPVFVPFRNRKNKEGCPILLARSFAPLRMTERKPAPSIWKSAGNRKNGNRLLLRNFIRSFLDNILGTKELQIQVVNQAFDGVHCLRGEVAGGAEEGGGVAGGGCPVGAGRDGI